MDSASARKCTPATLAATGALLAVSGTALAALCHIGTVMLLAMLFAFGGWTAGVEFVLHTAFARIVLVLGLCGRVIAVGGGVLAAWALARASKASPLKEWRFGSYLALVLGAVMLYLLVAYGFSLY